MIDEAFKLFSVQVGQQVDEYNKSLNAEKNDFGSRYNIDYLFLGDYDYVIGLCNY